MIRFIKKNQRLLVFKNREPLILSPGLRFVSPISPTVLIELDDKIPGWKSLNPQELNERIFLLVFNKNEKEVRSARENYAAKKRKDEILIEYSIREPARDNSRHRNVLKLAFIFIGLPLLIATILLSVFAGSMLLERALTESRDVQYVHMIIIVFFTVFGLILFFRKKTYGFTLQRDRTAQRIAFQLFSQVRNESKPLLKGSVPKEVLCHPDKQTLHSVDIRHYELKGGIVQSGLVLASVTLYTKHAEAVMLMGFARLGNAFSCGDRVRKFLSDESTQEITFIKPPNLLLPGLCWCVAFYAAWLAAT